MKFPASFFVIIAYSPGYKNEKISIHKSLKADLQHTWRKKILSHINYARKYPFAMHAMHGSTTKRGRRKLVQCLLFFHNRLMDYEE